MEGRKRAKTDFRVHRDPPFDHSSVNQAKTDFLLFHPPTITVPCNVLPLNLDGHEIPSSPSICNLDGIFDYSMTMAEHITHLSRSINWQLQNLNRIRKFLDTSTCHNIVRTLILSKLDYCNSLLYGIDKKHLNRLQILQNRCARLILTQPSHTHASPLFFFFFLYLVTLLSNQ